jgi:hypothetical protein
MISNMNVAGIGVALHQRADIDIALGDNPVERCHDQGIGPVQPQHPEQAFLRRDICLRDADGGRSNLNRLCFCSLAIVPLRTSIVGCVSGEFL